jgi:spectinomycin phosphotransferase
MLQKPDLQDKKIIVVLQEVYGIQGTEIAFLPLGADLRTAVYRVDSAEGTPYFVKVRRGDFNEIALTLPQFLHEQGVKQIIAPLPTTAGTLHTPLEDFQLMVYPFIEGDNGYVVGLSEEQWQELGEAFKRVHTTPIPTPLQASVPCETYTPKWRGIVKSYVKRDEADAYTDPIALELFAFLKERREEILALVERAEQLAQELEAHPREFVLCHTDIHAGNVLIERNGGFYIVDWDDPILAPKERDLMYFGAGLWGRWHTPQEEETLFFRGYGQTEIDQTVLAYYRFERIVQDIAVDCSHILQINADHEDRAQSLYYLTGNFQPNSTVDLAYQADPSRKK